jgi:hypothetical protein
MILAAAAFATSLVIASPPTIAPAPNLYRSPAAGCQYIARRVTEDQQETLQKLGRLPNGVLMYAVERKIGGCAVPTPVGYHPPSLPGKADQPGR